MKKTTEELIWNYLSVLIMAIGGFLFSLIIAYFYDAKTLGIFNESYTCYIILSQFCALGIHNAIIKFISNNNNKDNECNYIFGTSLILILLISLFISFIFGTIIVKKLPVSLELKYSLYYIIPALIPFAINKMLLNYLNGLMLMKEYAFFQGLRNILISGIILLFSLYKTSNFKLTLSFLVGELILMLFIIAYLIKKKIFSLSFSIKWAKSILDFGIKILPSNIVLELNTKVDILCLSFLLKNEELIGVYSFVSLFSEGTYQIFMVIRRNINPKIQKWINEKKLGCEYKKIKKICTMIFFPITIMIIISYLLIVKVLKSDIYYLGLIPLIIIVIGISINGISIVFGNIISLAGYPTCESIINCFTVFINFVFNIFLIKKYELIGAAFASTLSYCFFTILIIYIMKRKRYI